MENNQNTNTLDSLVNFPILLAPMVGITHAAMRKSLSKFIPTEARTIWPTEMLSSRKIPDQKLDELPQTVKWSGDTNLCPQILGNQETHIRNTIIKLEQWGAKAIDINMGCSVKKALRHNYGVSLMGDTEYASSVVRMAKRSSKLPVSVKLRAGLQKDLSYLLDFTQSLVDAGASWLCLHPRLSTEGRKGSADWSQIKYLKDNLSVPIIGNGDIQTFQDIQDMFEQTNCDAVMIGRVLTAKPWLLTEYAKHKGFKLTQKQEELIPSNGQQRAKIYGEYLYDFVVNCYDLFEEDDALKRVRFFVKVGHPWLNFGHKLYKEIHKLTNKDDLLKFLETYFKNSCLSQSDRTQLRY